MLKNIIYSRPLLFPIKVAGMGMLRIDLSAPDGVGWRLIDSNVGFHWSADGSHAPSSALDGLCVCAVWPCS